MKTLFIFGLDTVAGANIASTLSSQYRIVGAVEKSPVEIRDCQVLSGKTAQASPASLLKDVQPDYVLDASCCGDSSWNPQAKIGQEAQCQASIERAKACATLQIPFTFLSSDAVLTGPWMFHEEDSAGYSRCECSQRLLKTEQAIQNIHSEALIVRTHPIGWSTFAGENSTGWIESLLSRMRTARPCFELNQPGYATPLLASELACILQQAWSENLKGLYHIAGAERVNRFQFARRVAEYFQLRTAPLCSSENHFTTTDRQNFGCGEASLQTRAIRRELGVAMPTLGESLQILLDQRDNGYLTGLSVSASASLSRAA